MKFDQLYARTPAPVQDLAVSAKGWAIHRRRYGRHFKESLREFMERDGSAERVNLHRAAMLSRALERASKTQFYGDLFRSMGIRWQEVLDPAVFVELPVLKKSDIVGNEGAFRPRPSLPSDVTVTTSGTTGTSFSFPASFNVESEQWAVWWRYRSWHNLRLGDRCALFASTPVIQGPVGERPYRVNLAANEYRFSIFHINAGTAPMYVRSLNRMGACWIHGIPTAISLLASHMLDLGLSLDYVPRCISVGSANLLGWQRDAITRAFNCSPIQHYGLTEGVANMSQCEFGSLHTDEDYSYVEFLPVAGSNARSIVGTSFSNEAFALLRYDTGDLATVSDRTCGCGRPGRIVDAIDGRLTDYVVLHDGSRVAALAAPFHSATDLIGAQIYQGQDGNLVIRYIPGRNWSEDHARRLELALRKRLGDEIGISFRRVSELDKTSRGKIKLVVSDYDAQYHAASQSSESQ